VNPLIVRNLSRRFGGVLALDDVSLEICAGERRAIIGTNGAGKTTLFNIINGQVAASSGAMWLFGQEVSRVPPHRRVALGLARTFQITSLFPNLSVMENMIIAVQALASCRFVFYRRVEGCRDILARTTDLLERWQLWDMRTEIVRNLSYGVQRQLEIVMALAGDPKLLLLDEPMAGLSAVESHLATDIILNLDRRITILLIEHDLTTAFRIADRITAMDQGRIVADGTPDEIRKEANLKKIYLRGTAAPPSDGGVR
jgi:branched-chain amino acid transport system ATP-binding protein